MECLVDEAGIEILALQEMGIPLARSQAELTPLQKEVLLRAKQRQIEAIERELQRR